MTDTLQKIFDETRLGDMISYSDGTPRPPARHTKKLRDWENNNSGGRLVNKGAARYFGYSFTLQKKLSGPIASVIGKYSTVIPLTSFYKFEIISRLPVGAWRVIRCLTTAHELEFWSESKEEAETFLKEHNHGNDLVLDQVSEEPSQYDKYFEC